MKVIKEKYYIVAILWLVRKSHNKHFKCQKSIYENKDKKKIFYAKDDKLGCVC